MHTRPTKNVIMLDAKGADGVGSAIDVSDARHITIIFGTASNTNATIKLQASAEKTVPDFAAAQTVLNHWDYVAAYDYEDAALIEGDTGIALTGTDDFRTLTINTDGVNWLSGIISSWVAGAVTIKVQPYTNQ